MLKHWQSHQEYLFFLHEAKVNFDSALRKSLSSTVGFPYRLHTEFRTLNPDTSIKNLCLDSAHDNYPTYNLCKAWDVRLYTPVARGTEEYKNL